MEKNIDLSRFIEAQRSSYPDALAEIKRGKKTSHWMWYIFPQIYGLGRSYTSQYYAIRNLNEAKAFLTDPFLGKNLTEISSALLELKESDPNRIFGSPDDMKLRSCMTLFASISEDGSVFHQVLDKYFHGRMDNRTISILRHDIP